MLDINGDMLEVGRDRAREKGLDDKLEFVQANAESLPFPDNHFDAYTIAFGIRNVPRIQVALEEALSRAQARRAVPVPRILAGRTCRASTRSTRPIPSM